MNDNFDIEISIPKFTRIELPESKIAIYTSNPDSSPELDESIMPDFAVPIDCKCWITPFEPKNSDRSS